VHLYWQVDNPDDLHEYTGMLGLAGVFGWLTFTPVVTDATATGDAAWFDTPERERFTIYSRPGPEQLVNGEELRHGTAADVAVADNAGNTWAGRRVLVAGGPEDATAVNDDRRPAVRPVLQDPTTPTPQPLTGITQHRFSHHPLSFATTHGCEACMRAEASMRRHMSRISRRSAALRLSSLRWGRIRLVGRDVAMGRSAVRFRFGQTSFSLLGKALCKKQEKGQL
jgi:hypothetical protein